MKYIIALYNNTDNGKTQTLWHIAKLLISDNSNTIKFSTLSENPQLDFSLVIEVDGEIILIESTVDSSKNNYTKMRKFNLEYNVNYVFCATHTSGQTLLDVNRFANEYGFKTIWTSNYQIDEDNNYDFFNKLKAKHLLQSMMRYRLSKAKLC